MAGKKGMKTYPYEIRVAAIEMFFIEKLKKKTIMELLDVKNDTQLEEWFRLYRKFGFEGLSPKKKGRPKKSKENEAVPCAEARIKQLEMENELLRAFLSELGRM